MTDIEEALEIIWARCQHCKDVQEALEILRGERPHGEWIETYYSIDGIGASRFKCTKCENEISTYGEPYNFCPNCGARMEKEGEAE